MRAVLRALDEVPREHFVGTISRRRPMPTRRCRSPAGRPSASPTWSAYMTEQLDRQPRTRCSRSAPDRDTRPPSSPAWRRRWSRSSVPGRWRSAARRAWTTLGYQNVEIRTGDGLAGAAGQGAVRPHHDHGGGARRAGGAGRAAGRRRCHVAAAWAPWRRAAPGKVTKAEVNCSRSSCSVFASCRCCRDRRASLRAHCARHDHAQQIVRRARGAPANAL